MIEKNIAPLMGATRVVLAIAMAGSCAFAQSEAAQTAAPIEETELPAMTVSASSSSAIAIEDIGVSVTILNVDDLKEECIYTMSAALQQVPGVFTLPGGTYGQGNASNIAIRGMSSDAYILPTMDGMRLNNVSSNITMNVVGSYNTLNIGTLEVLRGSQAAIYGGGAIGGVLFMETPEGKGEPSYELFNEYGSFDTYTGSATAQGQVDKLSYYFNVTYMRTGNDLKMANGEKYPYSHAGKSENWQESLRFDYQLNEDNKTTATYRRVDSEYRDVSYGVSDYTRASNLITLKHESKISDAYTSSLMAGYFDNDNNFDAGATNATQNIQMEWKNNFKWNDKNKTQGGFAWNRSDYSAISPESTWSWGDMSGTTPAGEQRSIENIYALTAEHTYSPVKSWDNTVAARYDMSTIYDNEFTFRAASSYKFNQDNTRAFASVGTGYKAPSQFQSTDVYSNYYGTSYVGNPDLKTESSISFDFGMEQKIAENHKLSATYFWIQTKDKITEVYDESAWNTTFKNADGHALAQGVELSLSGIIEKTWNTSYTLAYTYTQPKYSDDTQIAYTARQLWSADINTKPCENLIVGMGLTAAVGRTTYLGEADNYYTMRLYAQYAVNENISLHLRIENLTNQKYVTSPDWSSSDYDLINAGTAIYGGCTIKF